jgi:hypothetical protein
VLPGGTVGCDGSESEMEIAIRNFYRIEIGPIIAVD